MSGEKVKIVVETDKIEVDGSKVFSTDVAASNGVMHSIGEVLVPKSMEGFAGPKSKERQIGHTHLRLCHR